MKESTKIANWLAVKRLVAMVFAVICGTVIWKLCQTLSVYELQLIVSIGGSGLIYLLFDYLIGDGGFWRVWFSEPHEPNSKSSTKR